MIGFGLVALGLGIAALIPVFLVAYPAAGIGQADSQNPAVVLPALASNPALILVPGAIQIAAHAVGVVAILGLWAGLGRTSFLLTCATLFGLIWLGVDTVLNAVTFHVVPVLATANAAGSPGAGSSFLELGQLIDGARYGGHVAGGLWMIGLSVFGIRTAALPGIVGWLGVLVGVIFAANLFVPALLNVSFMTVPAWLVILGIVVGRSASATVLTVGLGPAEA